MRPITSNPITQAQHGAFKAVDFSSKPDPIAYAPEDVTFVSFTFNGDCGWNLQVEGPSGRHGFCHVDEAYIGNDQTIRKGQRLFKMGYNGKTIPPGPDGRHAHWVLRLKNGTYVYPPSKITEPFGGGENMVNIPESEYKDLKEWKEKGRGLEQERDKILYPFIAAITAALGTPNDAKKVNESVEAVKGLKRERDEVLYPYVNEVAAALGVVNDAKKRSEVVAAINALKENNGFEIVPGPIYRKKA